MSNFCDEIFQNRTMMSPRHKIFLKQGRAVQ
jgi:hypothetical protein